MNDESYGDGALTGDSLDGCADSKSTVPQLPSEQAKALPGSGAVPLGRIPQDCNLITPQMLTLVPLDQRHIEHILRNVPGGARNVQEVYPLSPLQEGMLFHRLLNEKQSDTYVLSTLFELPSREQLEALIGALQKVIDRHDVLRTAVLWEELPRPVQVVYRSAGLPVEELALDGQRPVIEQLNEWMSPVNQRLDLHIAPLVLLQVAQDPHGARCYAVLRVHHLLCDHQSLQALVAEVLSCVAGREHELPPPAPFRDHFARILADDAARAAAAEAFFRSKLGDVCEPTIPFGLVAGRSDRRQVEEAHTALQPDLARAIRAQARRLGVSPARLFHAAWGLVVTHTSGRSDIVFGTVLLTGRQKGGRAQRMLGMSVNTLPLRLRLQDVTAEQLVRQTQHELAELLCHEQASLAIAQTCSAVAAATPLFTSLLNYRHSTPERDIELGSAGIRVLERREAWTNYPLAVTIDDIGDGFELTAQADEGIDPWRIAAYLCTALQTLAHALQEAPQTAVLSLQIIPPQERRELIELFNATYAVYPQQKLIYQLFEEQVLRTPRRTALVYGEESLSYAALNFKANQLARYLRGLGVGPDQPVGLCIERRLEMVVGLLGILKAGAAYLPLDPNYPPARLQYMLEDAAPRVVLTQQALQAALPATPAQIIALDSRWPEIAAHAPDNLAGEALGFSAEQLLYVIYTSGSTGRPKGTAMPHRAMVNLIEWHRSSFPGDRAPRVLQFAALSFDVAFQEIFSTLCTGGCLVLLDEWVRRDTPQLTALLSSQHIERLFVPPLVLQSLAEYCAAGGAIPRSLRDVITAGEQLRISAEIVKLFQQLEGCRLHNHYGPTETHVVTALTLAGNPQEWPTLPAIGRPIANTQIYILDEQRQPVPIAVTGEIQIGGAGLARGYLHRPELTGQRFLRDPFATDPFARLYKTGDLGLWRADGTLEYLGRNDEQVKIRGFRVEVGEIEAQLAQHEGVRETAVMARQEISGDKRLVAYFTVRGALPPTVEQLRAFLKRTLPEHMVPGAFVLLERMPLTPSGKLDRRALPAPELAAYASVQYESPRGEVEETLAQIWRELLHLERIGRLDDFFEVGGNSLLAMRVVARVRSALSIEIPIRWLFEYRTLRDFCAEVDALRRASLLNAIAEGSGDMQELLEKVASMPEHGVQDLLRNLRMEARP